MTRTHDRTGSWVSLGAIRRPGKRDTGMPPSVAGVRLAIGPPQAIKKRPSHRPAERFSTDCCVKNTQFRHARVAAWRRSRLKHFCYGFQPVNQVPSDRGAGPIAPKPRLVRSRINPGEHPCDSATGIQAGALRHPGTANSRQRPLPPNRTARIRAGAHPGARTCMARGSAGAMWITSAGGHDVEDVDDVGNVGGRLAETEGFEPSIRLYKRITV